MVTDKFCNERHSQQQRQCDERHENIDKSLGEINLKLDNHLMHLPEVISDKLKWHYRLAVITIVIILLFAMLPDSAKLDAFRSVLKLVGAF